MSTASDAIFDLAVSFADFKHLKREIDDEGVQVNDTEDLLNIEVRVIPTDPKEVDVSEMSTTSKIFFSFYIFGSFAFCENDILTHDGFDHKIWKGWNRNANGGYTKIIAGRQATKAYTNQTVPTGNTPYQDKILGIAGVETVCYYPQNEAVGGSAIKDLSGKMSDGLYVATTLEDRLSPSGTLCPLYDGISSYGQLVSAELDALLNTQEFSWGFFLAPGLPWQTSGFTLTFSRDNATQNFYYHRMTQPGNLYQYLVLQNGLTTEVSPAAAVPDNAFKYIALTFSKSNNRMRAYEDGIQLGPDLAIGNNDNGITFTDFFLGTFDSGLTAKAHMHMSDFVMTSRELTPAEIVSMGTPGG